MSTYRTPTPVVAVAALGLMVMVGVVAFHSGYGRGVASEREWFVPATTVTESVPVPVASIAPTDLKTEVVPGAYRVGIDIAEGVWTTPGAHGTCSWRRSFSSGGDPEADWYMNHSFEGPARVAVGKGEIFQFTGCTFSLERTSR